MKGLEQLERMLDRLVREPNNAAIFNEIGIALYRLKDWENAEKYLERAYELDSGNGEILYHYAFLLYLNSKWTEATEILKTYLKMHPKDPDALKQLGDSYYLIGNYRRAAEAYSQLRGEEDGAS